MSAVKEPKFFLCDGRRPPRYRGPGDAHSVQEWIWDPDQYRELFEGMPTGSLKGESTPFYLSSPEALERIHRVLPRIRVVAVLRDPIDRAYSNWAHLWADGLEPISDFIEACRQEEHRQQAGWAPFWRYLSTGRYGAQFEVLFGLFPRHQVHILRYKDLVDTPNDAIDSICRFLGAREHLVDSLDVHNVGSFVANTQLNTALRLTIRGGAWVGQFLPPRIWRRASRPVLRLLQHSPSHRPDLSVADRARLLPYFADDVARLESVTGLPFADWLSDDREPGTYSVRKSWAPSRRVAS